MTLIVPTVGENEILNKFLNQSLTLKLYSNNRIPAAGDTASSYTEVTGGGYANFALVFGTWVVSGGIATYVAHDFTFTGATGAPGTIYGYFVVNGSGVLCWAERFSESVVPFTPTNGSVIRVTARIQAS